jgi:DnaJ-class molecular chaperone
MKAIKQCPKCKGKGWVYTGKLVWKWFIIPLAEKRKCISCMGRGVR